MIGYPVEDVGVGGVGFVFHPRVLNCSISAQLQLMSRATGSFNRSADFLILLFLVIYRIYMLIICSLFVWFSCAH